MTGQDPQMLQTDIDVEDICVESTMRGSESLMKMKELDWQE